MKAVIIGQMLNTNFAGKLSGGIQAVERLHVKLLRELGYHVTFIGPQDTEPFPPWPDVLVKIPSLSQEASGELTRAQKSALSKQSSVEIREEILAIHPDLIINHSFSSSHVRLLAELSRTYPSICFIHNTPDTAMDIGVIAKVKHYQTLMLNGGALVCVSEYQRDLWRKALRKRLKNGESFNFLTENHIDKIYDHVVYPIFVEPQEPVEAAGHYIAISRPDPIKGVDKLLDLSLKCGIRFPFRLYLAHPTDLELNDYFVNKLKPKLKQMEDEGWDVKFYHNAPRQQLLDDLATATGCFIPCTVEASPVVFLEAGSYGVTSIVFAKERDGDLDHAAFHMLQNCLDVNVSEKSPEVVLGVGVMSCLKDQMSWRRALAEETALRHSFEQRLSEFRTVIDRVSGRKPRPGVFTW